MPREREELIREGGFKDAEKLFVLSYEGRITERKYFEDFRSSELFNNSGIIELVSLKRPKTGWGSDPLNVNKLIKKAKADYRFKESDEFWLIIDKDDWEPVHNVSFQDLYDECDSFENVFIAMSSPCFELWLLLHYCDLTGYSPDELSKIQANRKEDGDKKYLDMEISRKQNDGRGYNKRPNTSKLFPNIHLAVRRAKELDNPTERYPLAIGSHVYKIIEKIIK